MFILGYTAETKGKRVLVNCSDGDSKLIDNWQELVTYLLTRCDMAVVWNLDKFVRDISILLPKANCKELNETGRSFLPDKTKLYYQPSRVFGVTYAGEVNFYELSRYEDKQPENPQGLVVLAGNVIKAYESFGINPIRLTSPVSLYSEVLSKVNFPRACDLPSEALDMINGCAEIMSKEWREVYKIGHWQSNEVTDFDLRAGYPSIMARLPDISNARFFRANELPDKYSFGILDGEIDIVKSVSPFEHNDKYPIGKFPKKITTNQYRALYEHGIGTYKIKSGLFLTLPEKYDYPLSNTMQSLYKQRMAGDKYVNKIAKAISVGIGGRFQQIYDSGELGADYNSIYALMTTSGCMCKVMDAIYGMKLEQSVISVMVDGFLAETQAVLPDTPRMGAWRTNPPANFLVLSILYQWGADKHPLNLYYKDVVDKITANPELSYYGDIDLNMIETSREWAELPHTGKEWLSNKYNSTPATADTAVR